MSVRMFLLVFIIMIIIVMIAGRTKKHAVSKYRAMILIATRSFLP
jgi:hypothetical protein